MQPLANTDQLAFNFSVTFNRRMPPKNVCAKITESIDPQLVFWYFGPGGLGMEAVNYYKKHFFCPIGDEIGKRNGQWKAKCWLYDLTGWNALKSKTKNIGASNPLADKIDAFAIPYIQTIKSSDFFDWLKNKQDLAFSTYINKSVLGRPAIYKCSAAKSDCHFTVGEVFNNCASMIENLYGYDCQKSYSSFQYIEALYLIQRIVKERLQQNSKMIEIGFVVPNDEEKYYLNDNQGDDFRTDLEFVLKNRFGDSLHDVELKVSFHSFIFGHMDHRPYLSGKIMKEEISEHDFKKR